MSTEMARRTWCCTSAPKTRGLRVETLPPFLREKLLVDRQSRGQILSEQWGVGLSINISTSIT
jgi:hypothetical protein